MNQAFQKVVSHYKKAPTLTHQQEVMRMYRKALRTINSWSENRDVFIEAAEEVRAEFDAHKSIPLDSGKLKRVMREGWDRLASQTHPDPYIQPFMPGGTLFMRNPAIPIQAMYPDGDVPAGMTKRRLNIDMTLVPEDQPYANPVFVDSVNKQYWIDK